MEAVRRWHEELKELCTWYADNDRYIHMGLIQKFGELKAILNDTDKPETTWKIKSEFEVKDEEK